MNGKQNLNNPQHPACFIPRVNAQPFFHGSLFSGIGGFDLAAEWAGWQNAFHCEWNEFGQKILKHYWTKAISYGDITKTDFTIHRGTIDVLTGGFPCQPYSLAGKRKGKEDERHLWPEMLRAIREISPTYIVGENVYGLVNWNGGLVFHEVQTDLENEGYEVQPVILPACAVGAPHRRERIWFVAYSNKRTAGPSRTSERTFGQRSYNNDEPKEWREQTEQHNGYGNVYGVNTDTGLFGQAKRQKQPMGIEQLCEKRNVTNTGCSERENGLHGKEQGRETTEFGDSYTKFGAWTKFPITEPTICGGNDGFSNELDGITFPKWRNESIKAYGNAIVPQVAYQIFNAINLHAASYGWR
ncbi:DNA (cytosine-5-)-methyltransferase [Flavobacterium sp. CYK-4]|uniref:DNA (cytosine-5-)-methyltransferase n=1 Tax=Flavobacterium lotistagni TaxID=2709660 RepID=UPI001407B21C|nr:DNA (cytosine-5-)-methyltransferase [Flavobacterium lotistagni]NHM07995.1 DNA (cytosine-5-)-methyltransferase [Flavobacterium lotistagni]